MPGRALRRWPCRSNANEEQDEDMTPAAAVAASEAPDWEPPEVKEEPQAGSASTGAPSGPSGSKQAAKAAVKACVMCRQLAGKACIFSACAWHCKHLRGADTACPQHGPFVPLPSLPPPPLPSPSKKGRKTA